MRYDFDEVIDRRGTDSVKWSLHSDDVLPLWVADMDFRSPKPVIDALRRRVEHGVFGYSVEPPELRDLLCEHLRRAHNWTVPPDHLVFLPGVVSGLNLACRVAGLPGDEVLIQTPIYPPFLVAPANASCVAKAVPLRYVDQRYEIDFDAFENAITARTKLFLLCNPHNPTGRVFSRAELEKLAEICLRRRVLICSDEIHKDFVYDGYRHLPIASLAPEIAEHTITLMSPSKTYNICGLHFAFAIVPRSDLRASMQRAAAGILDVPVNALAYVAAMAAYREGEAWLKQLRQYLQVNRDFLLDYVRSKLLGVAMPEPEGTYLAWLDCRGLALAQPADFFLTRARVALSDGTLFGDAGQGFVRLNFGCPRSLLSKALDRMADALARLT